MRAWHYCLILGCLLLSCQTGAQEASGEGLPDSLTDYERCILFNTLNAPNNKMASAIRSECEAFSEGREVAEQAPDSSPETKVGSGTGWHNILSTEINGQPGAISARSELEDVSKNSSFIITPHRPNYLLPVAFANDSDLSPYEGPGVDSAELDPTEAQFQLSLKFPLLDDFLVDDSTIWMGYTIRSFWQAYNSDISRPFRETNHEPEIFWNIPSTISLFGVRNVANELVFNHQSNGQSGSRSRSWNRIMLASYWEKGNLGIILKPWYRIPEGLALEDPDENPDIEDYLGNFEVVTHYQVANQSLSLMLRNNFAEENYGAIELSYVFPWLSKVDGTIKYFNGYGESLVDYNRRTERVSFGIQITDWF